MFIQIKRFVSLALAAITAALSLIAVPFSVSAAEVSVSKDDAKIMVYEMIKSGVENLATDIDISDYAQFTVGEISDIVREVVMKNPRFFYFDGKGNTTASNGKIVIISPSYIYTKSSIPSIKTDFLKYAGAILSKSERSWSDFEKALFVYEYLARQYVYDEDSPNDDAYALMKNGSGSSLAYAKLSYYLLGRLGVAVEYAHTGQYYFNAVQINGNWHYFDAAQGGEGVGAGMIHLNTFLISSAKAGVIYGDIECGVSCSSAAYDSAAWRKVYSGFAYAGGKWYYADSEQNGTNYECHLYTYDFSSGKSAKVDKVTIDNWKMWDNKSKVYTECFAGVTSNHGFIYYNTPEAIFKYNPSAGIAAEVSRPSTSDGYIYGIKITADKLYYKIEKVYSPTSGFTSDIQLNETYTVKFTNSGKTVKTYELAYGKVITDVAVPSKSSFNTSGWDFFISGMTVSGDAVFEAVHSNVYTYEFVDENGDVLKKVSAESGSYIIPPETHPEKAGAETANYSFARWDGFTACMKLTKDIKFKAVYGKTDKFKITLVYLNQKTVVYANPGDTLDSVPVPDPLTWSDDQYTYKYEGWEGFTAGMAINGDVTLTMKISKTPRRYTYQFINYDGTVFYTKTADYGSVIAAPSGNPSFSDNTGYKYSFLGWDGFSDGEKLTQDRVFYALYKGTKNGEAALRKYNISLYRNDGVFLTSESIYENQLLYLVSGNELDYEDLQYYYKFQNWEGYEDGMEVNRNLKFTAIYKKIAKLYGFAFYNNDESLISESKGAYGSVIPIPSEPTIAAEYPEIYKFTGWVYKVGEEIKTLENGMLLDGDYYFMATYEQAYTQCTITFADDDGTVLDTQVVDVLSIITGDLNTTQALNGKEDEDYTYEFAGWDGFTVNMVVTKDLTFTAVYTKTEKDTGRSRLPVPSEDSGDLLDKNTIYIIIGGAVLLIIIAVIAACVSGNKKREENSEEPENDDSSD